MKPRPITLLQLTAIIVTNFVAGFCVALTIVDFGWYHPQ